MGQLGKNGIVGLDDLFTIKPGMDESYSREEDILPVVKKDDNNPDNNGDKKDNGNPDPDNQVDNNEGNNGNEGSNKPDPNAGNQDNNGGVNSGGENENKNTEVISPVVDYKRMISSLSDRKVLPDLRDVRFGTEDGQEVSFDDMDINDEETFFNVISSIIENQKDDLMQNKIDVGSVSEFTKKLIQADKAGANILDILKQYDNTAAPIEKLNIDDKSDQLKIIRHYINLLDLPKEEADEFYKGIISKGEEYIEAKAIKYKSELDKKMDSIIAERTRQAEEKRAKDAEDFKRYKKELKASIQDKYQLNDNMVLKAIEFVTKPSKNNPNVTEANERIREMLTNPQMAPDLIMFLMNPEEFIKQKSNKRVGDEKKRIYKLVSTTSKTRDRSPIDGKGDEIKGVLFEEKEL